MVYYAMPLIMKSENGASNQHQLCMNSNQMVASDNYVNGQLPAPQQPQLINLSNGGGSSSPSPQTNYTYQLLTSSDHQQPQHHSSQNQAATSCRSASTKQVKSFKCEQCNMTFTTKSAHTSHTKSHAKQQTTAAGAQMQAANVSVNNQQMQSSGSLQSSGSMQSSDPYQCDVCKKTFAVPARLVSFFSRMCVNVNTKNPQNRKFNVSAALFSTKLLYSFQNYFIFLFIDEKDMLHTIFC